MALKVDFQNILQVFIYSNLPTLMNPANATNVVVTDAIVPIIPLTPTTPITPTIPNASISNGAATTTSTVSTSNGASTTTSTDSTSNGATTTTSTASTSNTETTNTSTASTSNTETTNTSTTSTSNTSTTPIITTSPVIMITPNVLQAIQAYVLNNFPDIGLPQDIQEVAKKFLSNLPPLVLITPTTSSTAAPANTIL